MIIEGLLFGIIVLMISAGISLIFISMIFIIIDWPLDLKTTLLIFGSVFIVIIIAACVGDYISPYDTWH